MDRREYVLWAIIAVMFVSGAYLYPSMPETMATHWDVNGEVNGYSSRTVGLFLIPVFTVGIYLLFKVIPHIAVYKKNIESFKKYYFYLIAGVVVFLSAVQVAMLAANLGYNFNISYIIMPAMGILFFGIGMILTKIKRNFFIGIRTPWTMSSDAVWDKTHRRGAKVFKVLGVLAVVSMIVPESLLYFVMFALVGMVYLVVYSYVEYAKEKDGKN